MVERPTWEDAWLLYALVQAEGNAKEAVRIADYANHAIPTDEEWRHAQMVFEALGLAAVAEKDIKLTPQAYQVGRSVCRPLDAIDQIHGKLLHIVDPS